jgi:hypothetical protein
MSNEKTQANLKKLKVVEVGPFINIYGIQYYKWNKKDKKQ